MRCSTAQVSWHLVFRRYRPIVIHHGLVHRAIEKRSMSLTQSEDRSEFIRNCYRSGASAEVPARAYVCALPPFVLKLVVSFSSIAPPVAVSGA
jgi:hypothetical protein